MEILLERAGGDSQNAVPAQGVSAPQCTKGRVTAETRNNQSCFRETRQQECVTRMKEWESLVLGRSLHRADEM